MRHLATATLDADEGLQRVIGLRSAVLSGNLVKVVTTAAKIGALAALPVMAIVASLLERPVESLAGLGLLALGSGILVLGTGGGALNQRRARVRECKLFCLRLVSSVSCLLSSVCAVGCRCLDSG